MKKLIILFIVGLLIASCDLESSGNGELDGFWQWCQMDTLSTNGTADMRSSRIFWNVQFNLLEMRSIDDYYKQVLFRFDHSGGKLIINKPILKNKEEGDMVINDPMALYDFGIYSLEEEFVVERLDGKEMILRNDRFRFHFRRY